MNNSLKKNALVIAGPTGVGKTQIAHEICKRIDGEIISADSRQIYRGLDIGTAKPQNPTVPHHLIDIVTPTERYDVASFVNDTVKTMEEITSRGKTPVIVGGTGLYIRSLTEGIFSGEFRDGMLRAQIKHRWENGEDLWNELHKIDPIAAQKIDPRNYVRIERALEVFYLTGKPISYWWERTSKPAENYRFLKVGLRMPMEKLYERITERAKRMVEGGLVDEVKNLLENGIPPNSPGLTSIGYPQVIRYIEGKISLEQMLIEIIKKTKDYARRQMIWFRKEPNLVWVDVDNFEDTVEAILVKWQNFILI